MCLGGSERMEWSSNITEISNDSPVETPQKLQCIFLRMELANYSMSVLLVHLNLTF